MTPRTRALRRLLEHCTAGHTTPLAWWGRDADEVTRLLWDGLIKEVKNTPGAEEYQLSAAGLAAARAAKGE